MGEHTPTPVTGSSQGKPVPPQEAPGTPTAVGSGGDSSPHAPLGPRWNGVQLAVVVTGALACALAASFALFLGGRAVQGPGASGLVFGYRDASRRQLTDTRGTLTLEFRCPMKS